MKRSTWTGPRRSLPLLLALAASLVGRSATAQPASTLGPDAVFPVQEVLVKDPADNFDTIDGPGIRFPEPGRYRVTVRFQRSEAAETDESFLGRVRIYRRTGDEEADCARTECWLRLRQITSRSPRPVTVTVRRDEQWLVGSWHVTGSKSRAGARDEADCRELECWDVTAVREDGRAGIRISFDAPAGRTDVTILPAR